MFTAVMLFYEFKKDDGLSETVASALQYMRLMLFVFLSCHRIAFCHVKLKLCFDMCFLLFPKVAVERVLW